MEGTGMEARFLCIYFVFVFNFYFFESLHRQP